MVLQKFLFTINAFHVAKTGWNIGPRRVTQADALINHAIFNKPVIDRYMKPGYQYIVMVREPVSWFKSVTMYYGDHVLENVSNTMHCFVCSCLGWDIGPTMVNQADVLINHALYKTNMIDKYVRPGYKYIVMVREPVSWFKSATKYYSFKAGHNVSTGVLSNRLKLMVLINVSRLNVLWHFSTTPIQLIFDLITNTTNVSPI